MVTAKGWEKVKRLEREHARLKYKAFSPEERLTIYEDLYRAALKLAPGKLSYPWPGDSEWHKVPHLRSLIEARKKLHKLFAK